METLLPIVVAVAFFVGIVAIGLLTLLFLDGRKRLRLQRRLDIQGAGAAVEVENGGSSVIAELAAQGRKVEALVDTQNETPRLLVQAGWRSAGARRNFYLAQLIVPIVVPGLVILLWLAAGDGARQINYVMYFLIALFGGFLLPRMILRRRAEARRARISGEVPLFIHLLVLLFEAGLSTRQAFASLVREGAGTLPELGREFAIVLRQLEAGGDTSEVLSNLGEALEVPDLTNVLSVLRQVDRYGGEIREPLLEALQVLEERRGMDMRERVNLTSGRMTVVMVLFFFPALLAFVAGPAFVSIIKALGEVSAGGG